MYLKSFAFVLVAIALNAFATEPSSPDDEADGLSRPRFVSPDGRYGLLVTERDEESQNDRVELIELATKRSLFVLSDPEEYTDQASDARLDWSADSQCVAAYTGGRLGGRTQVFVRDGDKFVEVRLPKLPELPNPEEPSTQLRKKHKFEIVKWITTRSTEFVRWLKSGDLELKVYNEVETVGDGIFSGEINATIAIDSKHHATLKKVAREEKFE